MFYIVFPLILRELDGRDDGERKKERERESERIKTEKHTHL
jgi:hypothetical protein